MKPGYLPTTLRGKLLHLAEEAAEMSQAILKTLRIAEKVGMKQALAGYNPELPIDEREANIDWIKRELEDVLIARDLLLAEKLISRCVSGTRSCSYMAHQTFRCSKCKKTVCYCDGGGEDDLCSKCFNQKETARNVRIQTQLKARAAATNSGRARAKPRRTQSAKSKPRRRTHRDRPRH